MAQISTIYHSQLSEYFGRIDAEFYKPISLNADKIIKDQKHQKLGHMVADGYRVVYESTKILNPDQIDYENDARFLQATNINSDGLWIEVNDIGYVNVRDWNRYPKGRIEHGEVLIEVKGQAEKVTIVQDYVPERTLVTGSVFKLSLKKDTISHEYLFAFFSSKYGKVLRDRTKVNTLIAYVSKPELYRIPVPIPITEQHDKITQLVKDSFNQQKLSKDLYTQATLLLEDALGLSSIEFKKEKSYTAPASGIVLGKRADAEFFNPKLRHYWNHLEESSGFELVPITQFCSVTKFGNPDYASSGTPIITQKHLGDISPEDFGSDPIASNGWVSKYPGAILKENDLLFYSVGAYLGKTNIWFNSETAVPASFITLLRPFSQADAGYLMLLLNSKYGILQSKVFQSGTSQQYIYPKDIRQFKVPSIPYELRKELYDLLRLSYDSKNESQSLLEKAKQEVETLIEQAVQTT